MSAFCVSETNKVPPKLSLHLSNTQQAKCQAHSSPNKPTLTQGFSRGENNCLFKCFFITSTSNLATHEVCHEEREIGSQLSPPVDSSPQKKAFSFCVSCFFSAMLCLFHPDCCVSSLTFNQMFLPQRPFPLVLHPHPYIFHWQTFQQYLKSLFFDFQVHWHDVSASVFFILSFFFFA